MLQIRTGPAQHDDQPLGFLLECHGRIRHFLGLAGKLATLTDVAPAERAQAASAVHRYFSVAFPLHASDEDELLIPALRPRAEPALLERLDALGAEHRTFDALLAELVPLSGTNCGRAGGVGRVSGAACVGRRTARRGARAPPCSRRARDVPRGWPIARLRDARRAPRAGGSKARSGALRIATRTTAARRSLRCPSSCWAGRRG